MSGITGIFRRDGRDADPDDIKKMNDKIAHRGPDGSRVWCEGPVAFGHQMLHTTQESLHEILPFEDEESGLVITADARIDNRKDLAPQLGIEDNEFVSDSYFILKAYEKWGEKCPEELLGDFAFAIWDKNKERLFCARDHMGVKPFYYFISDDIFIFSTEIKSIFSISDVSIKLNEIMVADYFLYNFNDKEITFYENILRLPNAHQISISRNRSKIYTFWELDISKEIKFDSNEEYINKFKEIFFEAVKCRLRSSSQVGALLSGGLDSSSIVCTSNEILKGTKTKINTFSAIFEGISQCDEREYINEVISKTKFNPFFIHADRLSPLYKYQDILWLFDQPFYAPNLFIQWKLFEEAQKNEVNVILDGFDGDTTLSRKNRYLADLAVNVQLKSLIKELKILSNRSEKNLANLFVKYVVIPIMPNKIKNLFFKLFRLLGMAKNDRLNFLNHRFVGEYYLEERYKSLYENKLDKANTSKKYHNFRLNSGSFQFLFELTNSLGSSLGIERRFPFFDVRLVEFSLALPNEQKYSYGWDRMILRQAMEDILPSKIQWRQSKADFSHNFDSSFKFFEKKLILNLFNEHGRPISNYVDLDYLKQIFNDNRTENSHHTLIKIWVSLTLSLWLENYNKIKNEEN